MIDDDHFAAVVGPNWESHYRDVFTRFGSSSRRGPRLSWNWAAALVPGWCLHRRIRAVNLAFFVAFLWLIQVVADFLVPLTERDVLIAVVAAYAMVSVLEGLLGDWLLYRRALRQAKRASASSADREQVLGQLSRRAPSALRLSVLLLVAAAAGFTVVYVEPMLHEEGHRAAIEKSYAAAMKSDLRNMITVQEAYLADSGTYAAALPEFSTSLYITITIQTATLTDWSATATHVRTSTTCGVFIGSPTNAPNPAVTREGTTFCW